MNVRSLAAALAACALGLSLGACGGGGGSTTKSGAQLISAGKLTVCSDVPYAPFEDFDKSSPTGFKGFDVDMTTYSAKGMNLDLVYKDSAFDPLQSGLALNSGQCDVAASAMTITADRKQNLDFSTGYAKVNQSLLVPDGSDIQSIDDLAGKQVGVQQGTTGKTYTEQNAPDAEVVSFPSDAEMFQALKAGQVDALLQDYPVNFVHQQQGGSQIVQTYPTAEEYGLAMKKGNTGLVDDVDAQLKKAQQDGTIKQLTDKYLSAG